MRIKLSPRVSFLTWCLVCAVVVGTFLPTLLVDFNNRMDPDRKTFSALAKNWVVHFGSDRPQADEWRVLNTESRSELEGYKGTVWLQRTLPELKWKHPYLFFSLMHRFEVFLDGERLYQFNMDNAHRYYHHQYVLHPVLISQQDGGKTLTIRTEWEGHAMLGNDLVLAGEADQILYVSILSEISWLIYSVLGLACGIAGLSMFIRRREALYGWFTLFCLSTGAYLLMSCRSVQWFVDMISMYYWKELLFPLAIWGCMGFYSRGFNDKHPFFPRLSHYVVVAYTLLAVVAAIGFPHFFLKYSTAGSVILILAGVVFISFSLFRNAVWVSGNRRERQSDFGGEERKWLLRGYWTLLACTLITSVSYMNPSLLTEWLNTRTYLYRIIEGLSPNSILLFMICMVMVLVARVRGVHLESERNAEELLVKNKELEQFHHHLEQLVEKRTAELEQANRTLALTLREKAETLAEMSVLEERNRIAYEMHDVVGHTLTAAIVQLEATKRLAERDSRLPLDKLDLLSELVRKGLDDIRKAVRLMKTDEEQPLSLEASLRELIQYAEDTMEIAVESQIALPAGLALGKMAESVIYHALQEGLTNGIRHGGSRQFRFVLRHEENALHFRLVSGGEPFGSAVPGFGLTSMMERVELLGGKVSIGSYASDEGIPKGCELTIYLPTR